MDMNQPAPAQAVFKMEIPRPGNLLMMRKPDSFASAFESLGIDCEVGNVQRFCGLDEETLFRSASLPYGSLLVFLGNNLSRLQNIDLWRVFPHSRSREWWMGFREGGIYYHSSKNFDDCNSAEVADYELPKIKSMVANFVEHLNNPRKTYIRCEPGKSRAEIVAAFRALRRYGRHTLLWVDETEDPSRVGKAELLEEGLVLGFIKKMSENAAPRPPDFAVWLTILARTLQFLKPARLNELTRQILREPMNTMLASPPTLLPEQIVRNSIEQRGPRSQPAPFVIRHTLLAETEWETASVFSVPVIGLVPQTLYVASVWVWIPKGFAGEVILTFPGTASVRAWPVDEERYGSWQRISTSVRLPEKNYRHHPSLKVKGPPGTEVFSAGWRFEVGVCPGDDLAAV